KQIKDFIAANQPVKMADLSAVFSNISPNTLKKDLQYLRNEQILTMIGERKSSVYMLVEC
ncbi:MAG: hypothetical protein LBU37_01345, partial [Tannerellaceae bacterium]|nr:hypothetical protein [Tannerellaceae bacterium]